MLLSERDDTGGREQWRSFGALLSSLSPKDDLAQEASWSLTLLRKMLNDSGDKSDWAGADSLSDVAMGQRAVPTTNGTTPSQDDSDIEYVSQRELTTHLLRKDLRVQASLTSLAEKHQHCQHILSVRRSKKRLPSHNIN